jgi:hypothetical protein
MKTVVVCSIHSGVLLRWGGRSVGGCQRRVLFHHIREPASKTLNVRIDVPPRPRTRHRSTVFVSIVLFIRYFCLVKKLSCVVTMSHI